MMLAIVSITLPIILIIYLIISTKSRKNVSPPGPPGLPLIGNFYQFVKTTNPHVYLWKLSKKYGPIIHMNFASIPVLVVSSAKTAKQVLRTQDLIYCNRPKFTAIKKLTYNCMDINFSPYNNYFREVRKITNTHLFSLKKVQSFRPIREQEVSNVIQKISARADDHQGVNLSKLFMTYASSVICRVAFSKRYDERRPEMRRFGEVTKTAQGLFASFFVADLFPWLSWVDKVSGLRNRLDSTFKELDSFYQQVIDEHLDRNRTMKETDVEDDADILDVLLRLKEDKSCSVDFEWDHIKALLTDIFIAGTDTTAATPVWAITALIKAPNAMKKAQEELRQVIGKKGKVDEDDLPKLPYLKAVVSETLRLYPPAPLLVGRETIEKSVFEGYEIQPGTLVYVNAWAVARDPDHWENPDEFLPERFLNGNIDIKGQDFGVIPFGSGRRICPGMFMGLANVELSIANLLYCFDWELPRGIKAHDIDLDCLPGLAMHKKNALYLVPKKYITTT